MQLWTEYEGVTIEGVFPLKKLLLPEGRSAFFSTANAKGEPAVMRLVECHFDEEEILTRWRSVGALGHPNFLKLERYGQLALDDRPVVYAVFERVDANMAEMVDRSRLTLPETTQLATSLASALETLHCHGFVHEHVALDNVFTVGDIVKLRGDCIRQAPEGEAGLAAKRRDVYDLAMLLLKARTRNATPEAAADLPAPLDAIVRNGASGAWGLAEIKDAALAAQLAPRSSSARRSSTAGAAVTQPPPPAKPVALSEREAPEPRPAAATATGRAFTRKFLPEIREAEHSLRTKWMGVAALLVFIALTCGWLVAHVRGRRTNTVQSVAAAKVAAAAERGVSDPDPSGVPAAAAASLPDQGQAGAGAQWRVVVYTYYHRAQAQKMSATIDGKHPNLRAAVFTPSGHAPYLVTVGGVMNKRQALALVRQSRRSGLPRDTYAQDYSGAAR